MSRRYRKNPIVGIALIIFSIYFLITNQPSPNTSPIAYESSRFLYQIFGPLVQLSWIIIGFGLPILVIVKIYRYYQLSRSGILEIDKLSGSDFEKRLQILYSQMGYKVTHTGKTGDFGVDLILEKNGVRTAVQAKCWNETVKEKAVQEVVASKAVHNCSEAWVVTNSEFTKNAKILAKANGVKMVNRNALIGELLAERGIDSQQTSSPAINTDPIKSKPTLIQSNFQLLDYISSQLRTGEKWPDIKNRLVQAGWNEKEIDQIYLKINYSNTAPPELETGGEQVKNSSGVTAS